MSASTARSQVFAGYRRLFRARKKLFRGDTEALGESRIAIKTEFVKNKGVEPSGPHFEGLLSMITEAEDMMIHGVVQGRLDQDSGNYKVKIEKEHMDSTDMPLVQPVTDEVVEKMQKPMVEVTPATDKEK